jgi:sterol desaturase/sphingolipid hydroxylase (fatty acid hydroxylase superfamily)
MSLGQASAWLLVINVGMFLLSIVGGEVLVRLLPSRRIAASPDPVESAEVLPTISCVLLNTLVAIVGWFLWRHGWIHVQTAGGYRILLDAVVLLVAMDFRIYVTHRLAHLPWVFPLIHATHYRYDRPRPLSLFVLNPAEVLEFGALWLVLLCVYTSTWAGMLLYLAVNLVFGTMGHLGVEPFPRAWSRWPVLRHVGSSTFHAGHHRHPEGNFGFYTDVWDRLFRTMK